MVERAKPKKAKAVPKKVSSGIKTKRSTSSEEVESDSDKALKVSEKVLQKKKDSKIQPRKTEVLKSETTSEIASQPPLELKFCLNENTEQIHGSEVKATPRKELSPEYLNVKLSHSLIRKLKEQAADEGISLDEFVTELLSESVVLRAWEIVERKNQMKGGNTNNPQATSGNNRHAMSGNSHGGNNNRNQGQRGSGKGHRGMSHMRYQTIMEDKASFLEYVRNQEKSRR